VNTLPAKTRNLFAGHHPGDFGPDLWNGVPHVVGGHISVPTPGTLGVLTLTPVLAHRPRTRESA